MPDNILKTLFPGLATDPHYKITSPQNCNYNCIAWSVVRDDTVLWPFDQPYDGTFWPGEVPRNASLPSFIGMYTLKGYEVCPTWEFEEGFQKIAIYIDPIKNVVTHGARQLANGFWTSKLGQLEDIQHGDPYSLQGGRYGEVSTFMRRENTSFRLKSKKKTKK